MKSDNDRFNEILISVCSLENTYQHSKNRTQREALLRDLLDKIHSLYCLKYPVMSADIPMLKMVEGIVLATYGVITGLMDQLKQEESGPVL